jgi:outer membrane protein OmpA-like peptidoglycan-associated protein
MKTMQTLLLGMAVVVFASATAFGQATVNTVVTITGHILNAKTLLPVECSYTLYDAGGAKISQTTKAHEVDGYLVTGLKPGEEYIIRIDDPRYFKQEYRIKVPKTTKYVEISRDFTVRPLESGRRIALAPNPFDLRKTTLKVGAEDLLSDVARMLAMNPQVRFEVQCFPDEVMAGDAARRISTDRGNALRAYFERAGVSGSRISVASAAGVDPIDPPPIRKGPKGKRYVGPVYIVITGV